LNSDQISQQNMSNFDFQHHGDSSPFSQNSSLQQGRNFYGTSGSGNQEGNKNWLNLF